MNLYSYRERLKKRSLIPIYVLSLATIGTILLLRSFAATPYVSIEPELGTVDGPAIAVNDTTASASQAKYVLFSNGVPKLKYEAENTSVATTNATIINDASKSYASGGALVGNFGNIGRFITFTVNAPSTGSYPASIMYASAYGGTVGSGPDPLPRTMIINNSITTTVNFARTTQIPDNWNSLTLKSLGSLSLNSGLNTITFRIDVNDFQYWDVDYLEVTGATTPTTCPPGTTGTPPNCVTPPPPPSGQRCLVYLHGRGGNGYPTETQYDAAGSYEHIRPSANESYALGGRVWIYFHPAYPDIYATGYPEMLSGIKAAIPASCGRIILMGFSNGGAAAAKIYCQGETFNGRLMGVIIDDPVTDTGTQSCNHAPSLPVVLYITGGLGTDTGNCYFAGNPYYFTCQDDTRLSPAQYASGLGTVVKQSIHTSHTPYIYPPELYQWW